MRKRCECWNCAFWEPYTDRRGRWGYCESTEHAEAFERPRGELRHREDGCGFWRHYRTHEDYAQYLGIQEGKK